MPLTVDDAFDESLSDSRFDSTSTSSLVVVAGPPLAPAVVAPPRHGDDRFVRIRDDMFSKQLVVDVVVVKPEALTRCHWSPDSDDALSFRSVFVATSDSTRVASTVVPHTAASAATATRSKAASTRCMQLEGDLRGEDDAAPPPQTAASADTAAWSRAASTRFIQDAGAEPQPPSTSPNSAGAAPFPAFRSSSSPQTRFAALVAARPSARSNCRHLSSTQSGIILVLFMAMLTPAPSVS
mmetsp:Transcript_8480/g.20425  ORF Transcript_8480/g.20425 Transcript_8480/m.20425 type:complete len:239 (+) Transcript_8480:4388-5104(+)